MHLAEEFNSLAISSVGEDVKKKQMTVFDDTKWNGYTGKPFSGYM